ncbi:hypothetical protein C8Q79DRAFT_927400 [Trametes meyenii]|nr:hypothetical protein C8Q79DRAFT_927400 [Trametes meyenii]
MVATFILTRAFAISALFVGAFPVVTTVTAAPARRAPPSEASGAPGTAVVVHGGRSLLDTVLIFAVRQKDRRLPKFEFEFEFADGDRGPTFTSQPAPVVKVFPFKFLSGRLGAHTRLSRRQRTGRRSTSTSIVPSTSNPHVAPDQIVTDQSVVDEQDAASRPPTLSTNGEDKRSCRQSSCLRDVEPGSGSPAGRAIADHQAPADTLLVRAADEAHPALAARRRSISVPRPESSSDEETSYSPDSEPVTVGAGALNLNANANANTNTNAEPKRSCRQSSCLRDVSSGGTLRIESDGLSLPALERA